MRVFISANLPQQEEIKLKIWHNEVEIIFKTDLALSNNLNEFDAFLILNQKLPEINFQHFAGKTVVINSVVDTLADLQLPDNISRINGWPGFLQREIWEIVSSDTVNTERIFNGIGWKTVFVKDEPGMVSARVISMIINEAYYALKEGVSTKEEIDLAMKLGTNYPFGPFEWAQKIGLDRIFLLLKKLSQDDKRCIPSFKTDMQTEIKISE